MKEEMKEEPMDVESSGKFEVIGDEIKEEPMEAESSGKLFQVLGNRPMVNLEALKVTSSWVSNATTFSAKIDETTSQKLENIELPEHLRASSPIQKWFPVQYSVLPTLLKELRVPPAFRPRDIAIAAPTGSGKTICYVLPVLAAIGTRKSNILQAVILVPVQTLVKQIVDEFDRWNTEGYAKVLALSGANDFEKEAKSLETEPPNVIVATPARFVQHLVNCIPAGIDLTKLRYLIVDEADRMGKLMREEWLEIVEYLCGGMSRVNCISDIITQRRAPQKIVLSATLSKDVEELHLWNLFKPRLFSATAKNSKEIFSKEINHVSGNLALPSSISHRLVICDAKWHPLAVYQHICRNNFNRTIIFVNEVASSNRLAHVLKELCAGKFEVDFFTAQLYGKRRHKMLQRFNTNENRIMISSDVLARGTDFNHVDCVINYNLPGDDKLFVHRAGRTGRAGHEGCVISVGDKETKRIFVKMLKVTNLYGETNEEFMEDSQFEKDKERYTKAIESLKSLVQPSTTRAAQRSGFEAKRKSRPTAKGEKPWLKKKNNQADQS